jgi:hypothetical protein
VNLLCGCNVKFMSYMDERVGNVTNIDVCDFMLICILCVLLCINCGEIEPNWLMLCNKKG